NPMGESTGAGDIFGTSGGVIEATIRTAYDTITGQELEKVEFEELRGLKGIKQAKVDINGREIKIAVANGLGNTRKLLEKLRNKEIELDAIEVMACPGGCIGGGGQPYHNGKISILKERSKGLYQIDKNKKLRKSYQNPYIKKLYQEYLGEVGSEKSKELLHTSYKARPKL
ncbi:MAG: iron hydrogenase small subunit, partial [Anaerococcus hydrogenalis]|nr:iron hydrogenase small subunit [Anaerococcus hydrogenalis]